MPTALLWFRRDLRLGDHPALLAAIDAAGPTGDVLPVFLLDDRLWRPAGGPAGCPAPIVDHAHERQVALARYKAVRKR